MDNVKVTPIVPANYVLLAGQQTNLVVGLDRNELDLVIAPKIVYCDEVKTVNRLINVIRPDKTVLTVKQVVTFKRVKGVNLINQRVSYTDWQPVNGNQFVSYVAPRVTGYVSPIVNSQLVIINDNDSILTVSYTSIVQPAFPRYIDVTGKTFDQLPTGYKVVSDQNSAEGSMLIVKEAVPPIEPVMFVTRTVKLVMPNGKIRTITQRVRKGSSFSAVHLPKLHGYKVEINGDIDKMAANSDVSASVRFVKC